MSVFTFDGVEGAASASGAGGAQLGDILLTAASTLGGSDLLPCNGSLVDATAYPALNTLLNQTSKTTAAYLLEELFFSGSNSNSDYRTRAIATSTANNGTVMIMTTDNRGDDPEVWYATGVFTASPTLVEGSASTDAITEDSYSSCISNDGSKAFSAFGQTGSITAYYLNSSGAIAKSSNYTCSGQAVNGNEVTGCAISGDGTLGVMGMYGSGNTNDIKLMYTTNGGQTFSDATKTGLPDITTGTAFGIDSTGSKIFLLSKGSETDEFDLFSTDDITSGSWDAKATITLEEGFHSTLGGKLFVGDSLSHVMYVDSGGSRTQITNELVTTLAISDNGGASFIYGVVSTKIVTSIGATLIAKVAACVQLKNGNLLYTIYRIEESNTQNRTVHTIETDNRTDTWLVDTYPSVALSDTVEYDLATGVTATESGAVLLWDPTNNKAMSFSGVISSYSRPVIQTVLFGAFTPQLTNNKILAE
jgi:hypothetical protein